ncbi:MAG: CAP domain-containing protein [Patescibacteria group bacterium]
MNKNTKNCKKIAFIAVFIGIFAFLSLGYAIASSITAKTIIKLANESRSKEGLKALQENPKLSAAASAKAEDMLKNDYFAHNSPSGKTPWYWMDKIGYNYKYAGENLAMNFFSAEEEQIAWMKSESHRKNILNANYQEIGVGIAEGKIDGKTTTVAVQMFGSSPNFVPVSQKVPEKSYQENKTAVLGDENKSLFPIETQEASEEDILVNDFVPEEVAKQGVAPAAAGSPRAFLKEKLSPENRPAWMVPLALNALWIILIGNLLFLAYSFSRKVKTAAKAEEENSGEQKIPVENLEDGEAEVSVAVKIHILHTAK